MSPIRPIRPILRSRRSAFTLIELLLVLVIITLLAAVVGPRLLGRAEDAKLKTARGSLSGIKTALGMFESSNGRLPTTDEGLHALVENPGGLSTWKGPYVDDVANFGKDPWEHPWIYRVPGSRSGDVYDLGTAGPDGRENTDDDIGNWKK